MFWIIHQQCWPVVHMVTHRSSFHRRTTLPVVNPISAFSPPSKPVIHQALMGPSFLAGTPPWKRKENPALTHTHRRLVQLWKTLVADARLIGWKRSHRSYHPCKGCHHKWAWQSSWNKAPHSSQWGQSQKDTGDHACHRHWKQTKKLNMKFAKDRQLKWLP